MSGKRSPKATASSSCTGPSEGNSLNSSTVCTETPSLQSSLCRLLLSGLQRQPSLDPSSFPILQLKELATGIRREDPDLARKVEDFVLKIERKANKLEEPEYLCDICACCHTAWHQYYLVSCPSCSHQTCLNCMFQLQFQLCSLCKTVYSKRESESFRQKYAHWVQSVLCRERPVQVRSYGIANETNSPLGCCGDWFAVSVDSYSLTGSGVPVKVALFIAQDFEGSHYITPTQPRSASCRQSKQLALAMDCRCRFQSQSSALGPVLSYKSQESKCLSFPRW
jgi:hypothetical protein